MSSMKVCIGEPIGWPGELEDCPVGPFYMEGSIYLKPEKTASTPKHNTNVLIFDMEGSLLWFAKDSSVISMKFSWKNGGEI